MKFFVFTLLFIVAVFAEDKYDDADDNFNLAEVLENERLLNSYSKCLLDQGPCTPEIKRLKDKLPEVLETRCAKCTDKQKVMGKQLAQEVQKKHPEIWSQLGKKYDSDGIYREAFEDFLRS